MRFKPLIPISIVLTLLLFPLSVSAAPVPWDNTFYLVSATKAECSVEFCDPSGVSSDSASGPTLPLAAYVEHLGVGDYAMSEMTTTTITMGYNNNFVGSRRSYYGFEFVGDYIANNELFVFYNEWGIESGGWNRLTIEDVTTSTVLFNDTYSGLQEYYISTPVGDRISVSVDYGSGERCCNGEFLSTRAYSMSVVPEPISSLLFVTGGTLLACRRYWKKRKSI